MSYVSNGFLQRGTQLIDKDNCAICLGNAYVISGLFCSR